MPSNKKSMIKNRFNGSEKAYREFMKNIGKKGGNSETNGQQSPLKGNSQLASELARKRWDKAKEQTK